MFYCSFLLCCNILREQQSHDFLDNLDSNLKNDFDFELYFKENHINELEQINFDIEMVMCNEKQFDIPTKNNLNLKRKFTKIENTSTEKEQMLLHDKNSKQSSINADLKTCGDFQRNNTFSSINEQKIRDLDYNLHIDRAFFNINTILKNNYFKISNIVENYSSLLNDFEHLKEAKNNQKITLEIMQSKSKKINIEMDVCDVLFLYFICMIKDNVGAKKFRENTICQFYNRIDFNTEYICSLNKFINNIYIFLIYEFNGYKNFTLSNEDFQKLFEDHINCNSENIPYQDCFEYLCYDKSISGKKLFNLSFLHAFVICPEIYYYLQFQIKNRQQALINVDNEKLNKVYKTDLIVVTALILEINRIKNEKFVLMRNRKIGNMIKFFRNHIYTTLSLYNYTFRSNLYLFVMFYNKKDHINGFTYNTFYIIPFLDTIDIYNLDLQEKINKSRINDHNYIIKSDKLVFKFYNQKNIETCIFNELYTFKNNLCNLLELDNISMYKSCDNISIFCIFNTNTKTIVDFCVTSKALQYKFVFYLIIMDITKILEL